MSSEFVEFFTQLLLVTFGVLAGSLISFRLLWPKVESYILKLNAINQNRSGDKAFQQLRFAAYERLLLLVHRISPQEVMARNHKAELSVQVFVNILQQDIENEYQHNLAQQLYVSDLAWRYLTDLKNDTLHLIRNVAEALPQNASLDQFVGAVLKHLRELEESPYIAVQRLLKQELTIK